MTVLTSNVSVGFGFNTDLTTERCTTWVSLSVDNRPILVSSAVARVIASQLVDLADFVDENNVTREVKPPEDAPEEIPESVET